MPVSYVQGQLQTPSNAPSDQAGSVPSLSLRQGNRRFGGRFGLPALVCSIVFLTLTSLIGYAIWLANKAPDRFGGETGHAIAPSHQDETVPQVEVDETVHGVRFGRWRWVYDLNRLGQPYRDKLSCDITVQAPLEATDLEVEQYDAAGRKLDKGWVHFPALRAGETAQAEIYSKADTFRIVIRFSDWARKRWEQQNKRENASRKKDGQPPQANDPQSPELPAPHSALTPNSEHLIETESVVALANEYRANAITASKKYDGKRIRIHRHVGAAEKLEKRADSFWLQEGIGQNVIGATYTGPALTGGTLVPVYGVEYQLSKEGEEQYAKLKAKERYGIDLIGTVKGTRPYTANSFGGTMLQITDCSFVASTKPEKEATEKSAHPAPPTRKRPAQTARQKKAQQQIEEMKRRQEEYQAAVEDAKAKRAMRGALNLLDNGHKEEARKRFQAIIDKYPDTPTAKQAKQQLEKLDEK